MAGEYDEILHRIKPGDSVLDAGANIGCFAALAGIRAGPAGTVVCVEPDAENSSQLRANIELNDLKNVKVVNQALYDRTGATVGFSSGGVMAHVDSDGKHLVRTIALRDLVAMNGLKGFDVIKLDIEGSEIRLLESQGAEDILNSSSAVAVEVHSAEAEESYLECLRRHGFKIEGLKTESGFIWRLLPRITRHPVLTTQLYGADIFRVSRRLLGGFCRPKASGVGYRPKILVGLRSHMCKTSEPNYSTTCE